MTGYTHGMNTDTVRELASQIDSTGRELRSIDTSIERVMADLSRQWDGPDYQRFRGWWYDQHRPSLQRLADSIEGLGRSARYNADDQDRASDVSQRPMGFPASGRSSHPIGSETYAISSDASLAIVGGSGEATVTVTEMSDGTFAVSISQDRDGDVGVSVNRLLKTLGIDQDIADLGLDVGTGDGMMITFSAESREDADALSDVLRGRVSSLGNRVPFIGGVGADEVLNQGAVERPGIVLESITTRHAGAGVGGDAAVLGRGADVGMERFNETTVHFESGITTDRTVWEFTGEGAGWNKDGQNEVIVSEVSRARDGSIVGVAVEKTTVSVADTRGGGEKRDAVLGFVPGVNVDNSESSVITEVTRYEFAPGTSAEIDSLALSDDRVGLSAAAQRNGAAAHQTNVVYSGDATGSTRGILGGTSTTEYSGDQLSYIQTKAPGETGWTKTN